MQNLLHTLPGFLLATLSLAAAAQSAPSRAPVPQASVPAPAAKAVAADKLEALRGGADTVTTQASLNATVADNTARNVVTGNNMIDNGSFANMSGMPMVIQNTGANVLIQNATVINLQMR